MCIHSVSVFAQKVLTFVAGAGICHIVLQISAPLQQHLQLSV